ncbi:hypothetical protein BDV23DRAFT_178987 [Aspergillus alliaceus]|uniref:Uncharacterized protein n=1 Tax=Petromyces alliaceus TaxID=209559 RepID=A0A5N7CMG0_PETAA|nr:hypothetical protein BDV23DRAFT_178987 [Aspergillus alliaceus]
MPQKYKTALQPLEPSQCPSLHPRQVKLPPPPPPPAAQEAHKSLPVTKAPFVAVTGPAGAFMVELLIYNGAPFKDHWAYWVRSHVHPDIGVLIHAAGDVKNGFNLEFKRSHDFRSTGNRRTKRVPLQWVGKEYFNEKLMLNDGKYKLDHVPVCFFEASAYKVKAPGKTLNAVDDKVYALGRYPFFLLSE